MSNARIYWGYLGMVGLLVACVVLSYERPAVVAPYVAKPMTYPSSIDGRMVTFEQYVAEKRTLEAYAEAVADAMEGRR